ncbi:MAG: FAD-binding oxidoreductase [Armatimonadota bacterium]|nr:FAD-binding oxidoreductase [Armatimonadota bacterium]
MREGLYAIVGSAGIGEVADTYSAQGALPSAVVMPESEAEVASLMEYASGVGFPCVVAGSGTHLDLLEPPPGDWWLLSTRRLARVVDYSPQDLVLTVGAGMTLQAVQEVLRPHNQYLPWNPPLPEQATIGGIVASNRNGSWRYRFGTPRDRLLAIRAVRTDGVAFKSGAKVVKSVAGYDLHRLLCGSWGTLAVITEITLKVQPMPQAFEAVGWRIAWDALEPTLATLMRMTLEPDGITVVVLKSAPEPALQPLTIGEPPQPLVLLEFSGRVEAIAWQTESLREQGYPLNPISAEALQALRDYLAPRRHALLLQVLMRPSEVASMLQEWSALPHVSLVAYAGSGVVYVAADEQGLTDALVQQCRTLHHRYRVLQGAKWLRAQTGGELPRLHLSAGELRLMRQLKAVLDPKGVLPNLV